MTTTHVPRYRRPTCPFCREVAGTPGSATATGEDAVTVELRCPHCWFKWSATMKAAHVPALQRFQSRERRARQE